MTFAIVAEQAPRGYPDAAPSAGHDPLVKSDGRTARDQWWALRDDLNHRYSESKNSQAAVLDLASAYGRLPDPDSHEVNEVLEEWLLSEDEGLRFDALHVVRAFAITDAVPSPRLLQDRLAGSPDPSAPYEWTKVNQILAVLVQGND